ncbi:MAG TPA: S8 family serine peptidase [Polyangiaceae bacterium]|nr:S8 family serine peptidase [Polyangiaceae bacterium]
MKLRRTGMVGTKSLAVLLCTICIGACGDDKKTDDAITSDVGKGDGGGNTESNEKDSGGPAKPTEPTSSGMGPTTSSADGGVKDAGAADGGSGDHGVHAAGAEGGVAITGKEPDSGGPTFSISGKLKIGTTLFVDSDGPNPDNPAIANDSPAKAQEISSPSTVGGYVGDIPVFDDNGDPTDKSNMDNFDVYKVSLAAGQTVTLVVAEPPDANGPPAADLDLFMKGVDDPMVTDDSQGIGDKEQVTAPVSGNYYISVERFDDPDVKTDDDTQAVYSLAVGIAQPTQMQMSIAQNKLSSKYDMKPGEAIIATGFGPQSAELAEQITPTHAPDVTGFQHVTLNGFGAFSTQSVADQRQQTVLAIKRLRKALGVRSVSPNYMLHTLGAPAANDPLLPIQWHYDQIDLGPAWDASDQTESSGRGAGVVVAVIDTGAAVDHPDFKNADGTSQLNDDGYDFISDPDVAADGDGRDDDPNDPGDGRTPGDSSFHGSHCAGTIAAATDNGEGGAGVAPKAHIMPIRALGRGGGSLEDIRQAVLYAAGLDNTAGVVPKKRADIISMSLGGEGLSDAMEAAVTAARGEGVIVIAAAGNSSTFAEGFSPGGEQGVVTVSATDFNRKLAFYSNFGQSNGTVEVAAPGGDTGVDENLDGNPDGVISMVYKNSGNTLYAAYQGTSMACPHVAGVAALMKAIWPAMGPSEFEKALKDITVDIGDEGQDPIFGYGLINANLAVSYALDKAGSTVLGQPVLSLSTTVMDFGGSSTQLPLAIANTGKTDLEITGVTASAPWLTVDPGEVRPDNLVSIDRSMLSDGVNTATITIASNGGTEIVTVRAFKGEEPTGGNLGGTYVMVVDPKTGESIQQAFAVPEDEYKFELTDIPGGKYYLVAGTDLRNTFYVGNDGDAYGAYPLSQDPELICRFQSADDAECPKTSKAVMDNPNLEDVTIPIEYLLDPGAKEQDADSASVKEQNLISAMSTPFHKPARFRRLK